MTSKTFFLFSSWLKNALGELMTAIEKFFLVMHAFEIRVKEFQKAK